MTVTLANKLLSVDKILYTTNPNKYLYYYSKIHTCVHTSTEFRYIRKFHADCALLSMLTAGVQMKLWVKCEENP
jgi:hypothetical protein